jgi:hypothetical protein
MDIRVRAFDPYLVAARAGMAQRRLLAPAALVGLALLAAGCGSSPGRSVAELGATTQTSSSASATATAGVGGALAFSTCMRSNGVPGYPDPGSNGTTPKESLQQLGVSAARFQSAVAACRRLLPGGGAGPSQAQIEQERAQALSYSQCVRGHGVPNFPDPATDGRIPDPATVGINQGSPKFQAANQACGRYRPPYMPSNAAYDAWARSQNA